jgi:aminopeptidase N
MRHFTLLSFLILANGVLQAQNLSQTPSFTRLDSLKGSITPERAWWDLQHYHLQVEVNPNTQTIAGLNTVQYKVIADSKRLQIDLQAPMILQKAVQNGQELAFEQEGSAHFITLTSPQTIGDLHAITLHFAGKPVVAIRPPWDGGLTWKQDSKGLPFVANSNQGIGSSIWWPNKDHPADEPDLGVLISAEVPEGLMDVSNGRLIKTDHNRKKKTKTYHWEVKNPINNYGINVNIGDYVHFGEKYAGEKGILDMDYYVLRENLEKARKQFAEAPRMMKAFEHWFGPYPFYEDGFKLVEVPYLGMEHQSSVTYGNGYANGYLGRDLSGSGWGLKFDFIIVHEAGHEWFANNITNRDVADMWIHEGFTAYSENLFLDYHFGKQASSEYVIGTRMNIQNDKPLIGPYEVDQNGSSDMYYKGANLLHTIRQLVNDDEKWRQILRGLNSNFYHQTVSSADVENYITTQSGLDLKPIFDQYLRDVRIPLFSYTIKGKSLHYRWENVVSDFAMPIKISVKGGEYKWLFPTTKWNILDLNEEKATVKLDSNFYVGSFNVTGD